MDEGSTAFWGTDQRKGRRTVSYNTELLLCNLFTVNTKLVPVSPFSICVDLGKALKHRLRASVFSSVIWE